MGYNINIYIQKPKGANNMKKLTLLLTCLALLLGVAMGCGALADETSPSLEFPDIIEVMPGVA